METRHHGNVEGDHGVRVVFLEHRVDSKDRLYSNRILAMVAIWEAHFLRGLNSYGQYVSGHF